MCFADCHKGSTSALTAAVPFAAAPLEERRRGVVHITRNMGTIGRVRNPKSELSWTTIFDSMLPAVVFVRSRCACVNPVVQDVLV